MLIDLAVDLAALIESVTDFQKVAVTPREPAATDKCSAAYVWGVRIFDTDQPFSSRDSSGCYSRRAYELGYRIDLCHTVRSDGKELTTAESLALAQTFYDTADTVWCAITQAQLEGTLFETITDCEDIVVGDLVFSGQGDRNSAQGSVLVTQPCEAGS